MPFPQYPNNTESDYAYLLPDPAVLCLSKLPRRDDPLSREPSHILLGQGLRSPLPG